MEQQPKYTIELTQEQLLSIGEALQELPFKIAAPIIGSINSQIQVVPQETQPLET